MAETLFFDRSGSKEKIYADITPQIHALIAGETNLIANLANIASALDMAFSHLWTGFYLNDGDSLVLGPFQGPIACTRIPLAPIARGVCGAAATHKKTQIVPNVEEFEGHIACSSASKSEIVIPFIVDDKVKFVLDIDSAQLNTFDENDEHCLKAIMAPLKHLHF